MDEKEIKIPAPEFEQYERVRLFWNGDRTTQIVARWYEYVERRQKAEGRRQKDQLVGDSDPPLIVDRQSEALAGVLNPKRNKEEVKPNLLPSALQLLPSRAKPDKNTKIDNLIVIMYYCSKL